MQRDADRYITRGLNQPLNLNKTGLRKYTNLNKFFRYRSIRNIGEYFNSIRILSNFISRGV